jgi:hypothetical protein
MTVARAVIGLDAGGTKTAGALATLDGHVIAQTRGGPGNYQSIGAKAARSVYADVLATLFERAAEAGLSVAACAFGLAGLDRPKDAAVLEPLLAELLPSGVPQRRGQRHVLGAARRQQHGSGVAVVSGHRQQLLRRRPRWPSDAHRGARLRVRRRRGRRAISAWTRSGRPFAGKMAATPRRF